MKLTRFAKCLEEWIKAAPHAVEVINRKDEPEVWERWREYYSRTGVSWAISIMNNRTTWTVPCKDPTTFDRDYLG